MHSMKKISYLRAIMMEIDTIFSLQGFAFGKNSGAMSCKHAWKYQIKYNKSYAINSMVSYFTVSCRIWSWKYCLLISSAAYIKNDIRILLPWKQTLWTLIRLLLREQSDLGSYCLQYWLPKYTRRWENRRYLLWMAGKGLLEDSKFYLIPQFYQSYFI